MGDLPLCQAVPGRDSSEAKGRLDPQPIWGGLGRPAATGRGHRAGSAPRHPSCWVAEAVSRFAAADVLFDLADMAVLGLQGEAAQAGDVADLTEHLHGSPYPPEGRFPWLRARVIGYRAPGRNRHFITSYHEWVK